MLRRSFVGGVLGCLGLRRLAWLPSPPTKVFTAPVPAGVYRIEAHGVYWYFNSSGQFIKVVVKENPNANA